MTLLLLLSAVLAGVLLVLFPASEVFLAHLVPMIWAVLVLFLTPQYVLHWYRYRRQQTETWTVRCRWIVQLTCLAGLTLFGTILMWPQYEAWFAFLQ